MHQILQAIPFDSVIRGEFLEGGFGGDDDGDGFGSIGVGVHADIGDDGGGAVDRLELGRKIEVRVDSRRRGNGKIAHLLERNVLAVQGLD